MRVNSNSSITLSLLLLLQLGFTHGRAGGARRMGCVILMISVLLKIRKRSITTTVFQVRNGQQTEWITQEDWISRQSLVHQFKNQGDIFYATPTYKPTIEAIAVLPFSSYSATNEERRHS